MKRLKGLMSLSLLSLMIGCLILTGCGKKSSIEISVEGNVYEVTPGGSLKFNASVKELNEAELQYTVSTDKAQITNAGLLTVAEDIAVPGTFTVVAKIGDVSSNIISINVVDLKPTSITLVPDNTKLAKGGDIGFNVTYNPTFATIKDYNLEVVGGTGAEMVEIDNGVLKVKESVSNDDAINKTVDVKATLTADSSISSTVTITIVDAEGIDNLAVADVSLLNTQNKSIEVKGYNAAGDIVNVDATECTFTSSNENVAFIQSNGKIVAKGHGTTTVTINYAGRSTTCYVNVMVPPASMSIERFTNEYFTTNNKISFSKVDPLDLELSFVNLNYSNRCSNAVDYTFKLYDDNFNVVATGDDVATVNDNGINFKVTGNVEVTIKSNSSIAGYPVPANLEKSITLNVDVNNGINVDTVAEFKAYAEQNTNTVCNVLSDIELTATENFGFNGDNPSSLEFYGERIINGNGYMLSLAKLPLGGEGSDDAYELLRFNHWYDVDPTNPATRKYWALENPNDKGFKVQITNFEILGNSGYNGVYSGALNNFNGAVTVNQSGDFRRTYDRALFISGGEYVQNDTTGSHRSYVEDLLLDNVKISGFQVGMRLRHVVDGTLSNINVSNCFANGIELVQNQLTMHNVTVGQVGAFGVEITPDEMDVAANGDLSPTAGANYNEKPDTKFTGYLNINNYNNGATTPYMQGFKLGTYSLIEVLDAVASIQIQTKTQDANTQLAINQLFQSIAKKDGAVNLYVLVFVNPDDTPQYVGSGKGNIDECLMGYSFDSSTDNILTFSDLVDNYLADNTYDGYKNFQYISLDLDVSLVMGGTANIGQVVLINELYNAN